MYLVFDIGVTHMRLATSSDGQNINDPKIISTPQNFQEGIVQFKQLAQELAGSEKIEAAAGGVKGPLDKEKSILINPPNLPDWKGKSFKEEVKKNLNIPVYLENDAQLAGLGEALYGAGQGYKIVAYLIVSTGVGGVRVIDGKIDSNSFGFEPGHQIIVPDGVPCGCGGRGHLESYTSGAGLEKIYHKNGEEITDPKAWDEVAKYLAIGLNNVTVHWSPDIIILGGSVMQSIPLENVNSYFKEYLTIFPTPPELVSAKLGDSAGLYGALSLLPAQ